MIALFVGDQPSSRNTDPDVAFLGTPSYTRLLNWCQYLSINDAYFVNRTSPKLPIMLKIMRQSGHPVVALGEAAHRTLLEGKVPCYKMPHPSPRNRLWNSAEVEHSYLKKLFEWLQANRPK